MQHPTLPEEILIDSVLGGMTPTERVIGRINCGGKPMRSPAMHPVGRHSAAVWLDSSDYEGRHRSRDFVIPAMVDGVLVRFNPGRAA